jgi:DNA-binding Lrp family transcriptional regulator
VAFVGLDRGIVDHWIYQDAEYFKVWFEMLYRARYSLESEKKLIDNILIDMNYGEFIYGRIKWSERLKVSERRLRTLMDKLTKDGMIEVVSNHPRFTVYRILNYAKYNQQNDQQEAQAEQGESDNIDQPSDQRATSRRPADDQRATTKEQSKQRKQGNKVKEEVIKEIYADKVTLSKDEYQKLITKYGGEELAKAAIEKLSIYKCSKVTKYVSDYHVLIGWIYEDFVKRKLIVLNGGKQNGGNGESNRGHAVGDTEPDWNKFVRR